MMKEDNNLNSKTRERKSNGRRSSILKRQDTCIISEGSDGSNDGPRTPRRVSFASTTMIREFHPTPWNFNASDESCSSAGNNSDTSATSTGPSSSNEDNDDVFVAGTAPALQNQTVTATASVNINISEEYISSCPENQPKVLSDAVKTFLHDVERVEGHQTVSGTRQNRAILYTEDMNESGMEITHSVSCLSQSFHKQHVEYVSEVTGEKKTDRLENVPSSANQTIFFSDMDQSLCAMDMTSNISQLSEPWMQPEHDQSVDIQRPKNLQVKHALNRIPSFSENKTSEYEDDDAFIELTCNIDQQKTSESTKLFSQVGGEEMEVTTNHTGETNLRFSADMDVVIPQRKPQLLDDLFTLVKKTAVASSVEKDSAISKNQQDDLEDMEETGDLSQSASRIVLSDITTRKALTPIEEMSIVSTNLSLADQENRFPSRRSSQSQALLSNLQKASSKLEQMYGALTHTNPLKLNPSIEKENWIPVDKENYPRLKNTQKSFIDRQTLGDVTESQTEAVCSRNVFNNANISGMKNVDVKTILLHTESIIDDPEIEFNLPPHAQSAQKHTENDKDTCSRVKRCTHSEIQEQDHEQSGSQSCSHRPHETADYIKEAIVVSTKPDGGTERETTMHFRDPEDMEFTMTNTKTIHIGPTKPGSKPMESNTLNEEGLYERIHKYEDASSVRERTQIFENDGLEITECQARTLYLENEIVTGNKGMSKLVESVPVTRACESNYVPGKTQIFDHGQMDMTECLSKTIHIENKAIEDSAQNIEVVNGAPPRVTSDIVQAGTQIFDNSLMEMTEGPTKTIYIGTGNDGDIGECSESGSHESSRVADTLGNIQNITVGKKVDMKTCLTETAHDNSNARKVFEGTHDIQAASVSSTRSASEGMQLFDNDFRGKTESAPSCIPAIGTNKSSEHFITDMSANTSDGETEKDSCCIEMDISQTKTVHSVGDLRDKMHTGSSELKSKASGTCRKPQDDSVDSVDLTRNTAQENEAILNLDNSKVNQAMNKSVELESDIAYDILSYENYNVSHALDFQAQNNSYAVSSRASEVEVKNSHDHLTNQAMSENLVKNSNQSEMNKMNTSEVSLSVVETKVTKGETVQVATKRNSPTNAAESGGFKRRRNEEDDTRFIPNTTATQDMTIEKKREELKRSLCKEVGLPVTFSRRSSTFDPFQRKKSCNFNLLLSRGNKETWQFRKDLDLNKTVATMNWQTQEKNMPVVDKHAQEDDIFDVPRGIKDLPTSVYEHSSSSSSSRSLEASQTAINSQTMESPADVQNKARKPSMATSSPLSSDGLKDAGEQVNTLWDEAAECSELLNDQEMPEMTEDISSSQLFKDGFEYEENLVISDLDFITLMEPPLASSNKPRLPSNFPDLCEMIGLSRGPPQQIKSVTPQVSSVSTTKEKLEAKVTVIPQNDCLKVHVNELETAINRAKQECKNRLLQFSNRPPEIYISAIHARESGKDISDLTLKAQELLNASRISAKAKWKRHKADYLMKYSDARELALKALDSEVDQVISETEKVIDLTNHVDKCLHEINVICGKKRELEVHQQELREVESEVNQMEIQCQELDVRVADMIKSNKEAADRLTKINTEQQEIDERLSWMRNLTEWTFLKNTEHIIQFGFLFDTLILQIHLNGNGDAQKKISKISLRSRLGAKSKPWAKLGHDLTVSSIDCEQLQETYKDYSQINQLLESVSAIVCDNRHLCSELKLAHLKHQLSISGNKLAFIVSDRKTRQKIQLETTVTSNTYPRVRFQWKAEILFGSVSSEDVTCTANHVLSGHNYINRVLQELEHLIAQWKS